MKIALVTGGVPFGGSTLFLLHLATGLKSLGVTTEIFSFTAENPLASDFKAHSVVVHLCDEKREIFEDRLTTIYHRLRQFCPTAVIANIGGESYEMLSYLPKGIVRIGIVHDLYMQPRELIPMYRDALEGVVVVSAHLAREVQAAAPGLPCSYLAHGIPISKSLPARDPNPCDPLKVIYFGRFGASKGSRFYPQVIHELQKRQVPFVWTLHGSGPDEQILKSELAREIKTGEVIMSAPVPRDKLFQIVRGHDIYIMASEAEGGPLTLLEAMSLGLVPICNDIPCMVQEVVRPDTGILIPTRNARAYAEMIADLDLHRTKLEQMSIAARQTITKRYSLEAMATRYIDFITSLRSETQVAWPTKIAPKPFRTASPFIRMIQSVYLARVMRRFLKRHNP